MRRNRRLLQETNQGQQVRLAYDGEHRLLASERIQTGTDGQRHSVLTRYHYDPMSRRVGKQHLKIVKGNENQSSPSQTSLQIQSSLWFGWDGDRMVTMQNDRQASTTIYEPGSFVPMLRVDKQLQADDRRAKGELRTYHVHCNHLGTPEALIETDSLQLVWQIELDPWGQTQREYNPNNMLQPIRMQGQQLAAETGLFYNRYRYYDPAGGRYVTQDPIGLAGGVNLYGYVGGFPLSHIDPLGLDNPGMGPYDAPTDNFAITKFKEIQNTPRADGNPLGWGCGDSKTDNFVPDKPLGSDFMLACRAHDECYGNKTGPTKKTCDDNFKKDMSKQCKGLKWPKKNVCEALVHDYHKAVDWFGEEAFKNARN